MSAPRRGARAAGLVAIGELTGVGLLASAGALIGWSAQRPSWATLAGLLLLVELLAFLRAPVRHAGQLGAHDRTTAELTRWRHRLVVGLGASVRRLGAPVAAGDALERLIAGAQLAAERTQRVVLPRFQATVFTVAAVAVAALASAGAAVLLAVGALAVVSSLAGFAARIAAAEEELGSARRELAARAAEAVEARLELGLLGAGGFLDLRSEQAVLRRARAAQQLRVARALAVGSATALAGASSYAAAVLLGAEGGIAATGALVVAIGALEAAGLATSAALAAPPSTQAAAAIEVLPAPAPGRPASRPRAAAPALRANAVAVVGEDGEQLLAPTTLEVAAGELVAVVGPSGAGKSTLLAAIAGIAPLAEGSSEVHGVALQGLADVDRARLVAFVGHEDGILPGSVREALKMGRRDLGDPELLQALTHVGLDGVLGPRGGLDLELEAGGANLSTGERRRLAVARALATGAPVWLLDEPAAGLDPESADALGEVIARLGASRAVVVVTHRDADAAAATRRLEVRNGAVVS